MSFHDGCSAVAGLEVEALDLDVGLAEVLETGFALEVGAAFLLVGFLLVLLAGLAAETGAAVSTCSTWGSVASGRVAMAGVSTVDMVKTRDFGKHCKSRHPDFYTPSGCAEFPGR